MRDRALKRGSKTNELFAVCPHKDMSLWVNNDDLVRQMCLVIDWLQGEWTGTRAYASRARTSMSDVQECISRNGRPCQDCSNEHHISLSLLGSEICSPK